MLSQNGDILLENSTRCVKLPHFFMKKTTRHIVPNFDKFEKVNNFQFITKHHSCLLTQKPHLCPCSVTMSLTRGQYAWFSISEGFLRFDNTGRSTTESLSTELSVENHQRLNVEKHSLDWKFHWLVGLTDGDGSFTVDPHLKPNGHISWNLAFKISLKVYNKRALMKAKKILGVGKVESSPDNMITFRIRDRELLNKHVFPLFDRVPLLTHKHYDYIRLRQIARLLDDPFLCEKERQQKIHYLYCLKSSREAIAPIWHQKFPEIADLDDFVKRFKQNTKLTFDVTRPQIETVLSLPWLSGFVEADGSFYIVNKDKATGRFCHAFGLCQIGNCLVMQSIRVYLKICAKIQYRQPASFKNRKHKGDYKIETTNWRTLAIIREVFQNNLLGMKSQEFRIWERTFKFRHFHKKLEQTQMLLRKQRTRWKLDNVSKKQV